MTNAELLEQTRIATRKYNKRAASANEALVDLKKITQALVDLCKPCCIRAVRIYNDNAEFPHIMLGHLNLAFCTKSDSVSLGIRLCYKDGSEPDEDFDDSKDVRKIFTVLRPLVDHEFREAQIPLTLGNITVPSDYYEK